MRHERCRSIDGRNILPQSVGQAVSAWWTPRKLAIPLGALVLGGLLVLARREYALAVYVALSFAAIGATPHQTQFPRYLLPLYRSWPWRCSNS